jgi:hypothetical protein
MTFPISLTSISSRLDLLVRTLRILLNQTLKPSGIYVYLSKEPYGIDEGCSSLPKDLQILFATEPLLHFRWVENTGPYRKLLPFAKEFPNTPVLVVDDDTKYLPTLVERAWALWQLHHACITFRATILDLSTSYMTWPNASGKTAVTLFAKGNGGVVYHTSWFQDARIHEFAKYRELAPLADDIWLNAWRIKQGISCYCEPEASFTHSVSNRKCLFQINESKNDETLRVTWAYVFADER